MWIKYQRKFVILYAIKNQFAAHVISIETENTQFVVITLTWLRVFITHVDNTLARWLDQFKPYVLDNEYWI
jgi:hypothetical protein